MSTDLSSQEAEHYNDITGMEAWREYVFPTGVYRISNPTHFRVKRGTNGDSHRVIDAAGLRHYVPAGWLGIRFDGKFELGAVKGIPAFQSDGGNIAG